MRLAILVCVLLHGCASIPEGARPLAASDYRAALRVWTDREQPAGRCELYTGEGELLVVLVDSTAELCHDDVNGCLASVSPGLFGSGGWYPLLVMRRDLESRGLLGHELTHWLARCAGIRAGDHAHAAPGLWGEQGVEGEISREIQGGR